jgi:hypothetical protein
MGNAVAFKNRLLMRLERLGDQFSNVEGTK